MADVFWTHEERRNGKSNSKWYARVQERKRKIKRKIYIGRLLKATGKQT